jgi:hypothetical protein
MRYVAQNDRSVPGGGDHERKVPWSVPSCGLSSGVTAASPSTRRRLRAVLQRQDIGAQVRPFLPKDSRIGLEVPLLTHNPVLGVRKRRDKRPVALYAVPPCGRKRRCVLTTTSISLGRTPSRSRFDSNWPPGSCGFLSPIPVSTSIVRPELRTRNESRLTGRAPSAVSSSLNAARYISSARRRRGTTGGRASCCPLRSGSRRCRPLRAPYSLLHLQLDRDEHRWT